MIFLVVVAVDGVVMFAGEMVAVVVLGLVDALSMVAVGLESV